MSIPQTTRGRLVGISGDPQAFRFTVKSSKERKRLSLEQRVLDLEEVADQLIQGQATRDLDFSNDSYWTRCHDTYTPEQIAQEPSILKSVWLVMKGFLHRIGYGPQAER